ncbi:uncharacterized protein LOC106883152 [Octopus bimaculoides]|uniref:Protein quiver n=1 Tax=Octopus bimaculoides TaxID=37653 RepID=A0A0L8FIE1_OCTBM|nr:uncharacterized protein LOC106883152 [Octopus bimaculoides]|eukprot:XP_014789546.1 PREDICTED: uncharacterized protein LOC106883152 [Octopus bimaculoides]
MAAFVRFFIISCFLYSKINYVVNINCYACHRCSYLLNFTIDKYSVVSGCNKCQTTVDYSDPFKADRRCVTSEQEQYFDLLDINYQEGCRNISQIPTVEEPKFYCFCLENLCNRASKGKFDILALKFSFSLLLFYILF